VSEDVGHRIVSMEIAVFCWILMGEYSAVSRIN
jgi:hypothetical protein